MKKLFLITNDKISGKKNKYTSNNDLDNIISCLNDDYSLQLICRKSSKKFEYLIDEKFNFCKILDIKEKKINIFMISITPYNFFCLLKLILLRKKLKGFVFLRSDGFLEYKIRYGIFGYFLYFLMFCVIKKRLKILSVSKKFKHVNVKKTLHPSELTSSWLKKKKLTKRFKADFLYLGRFKKEKGVDYLIDIFKKNFYKFKLKVVGTEKRYIKKEYYSKNINFIGPINNQKKLIELYDTSKIFILPSYTEGFPKVISESLARLRPVIIFNEIKHVLNNRKGIFVCKRDIKNINKIINFILNNYKNIEKMISKNKLYTKNNFKRELLNSIQNEFTN
jgi:glycosyltransferase involved in cell wall biosynthesis